MHWSGAYEGYGSGSLDRDVEEMGALIDHLRSQGERRLIKVLSSSLRSAQLVVLRLDSGIHADGLETIVIMGHSTGSQDVIHYLTCPLASSSSQRPEVEGGIMQAPASDREYFEQVDDSLTQPLGALLPIAEEMIARGKGQNWMDSGPGKEMGTMTAYRFHSLYGKGYVSRLLFSFNDIA